MKTSRLLTIVIILQAIMIAGQWLGSPSLISSASAQADPGRDRLQMLDQLTAINGKLDKLNDILQSGDLQVRVIQSDDPKGKASAR